MGEQGGAWKRSSPSGRSGAPAGPGRGPGPGTAGQPRKRGSPRHGFTTQWPARARAPHPGSGGAPTRTRTALAPLPNGARPLPAPARTTGDTRNPAAAPRQHHGPRRHEQGTNRHKSKDSQGACGSPRHGPGRAPTADADPGGPQKRRERRKAEVARSSPSEAKTCRDSDPYQKYKNFPKPFVFMRCLWQTHCETSLQTTGDKIQY